MGNSAIDEILDEAVTWHAMARHDRAVERARDGLAHAPDSPELLRVVLRASIAQGDRDATADTARRLATLPGQPDAAEITVTTALEVDEVKAARDAVALAEAEDRLPGWMTAALKARIALATGDLLAARAILVVALEHAPENGALRALLTEAMVASGTASDARAVLGHVGRPPTDPEDRAVTARTGTLPGSLRDANDP